MTTAFDELMDYNDVLEQYEPVMGMEVHVELATETKMFSTSSARFGAEPNSHVEPRLPRTARGAPSRQCQRRGMGH